MSIRTNIRLVLVALFATLAMAMQAQTTISGNVKDGTGEDVIGATVAERGNEKNATVTDIEGNFTLKLNGNQIVVSYIGMKSKTVNVAGRKTVNVVLEEDNTTLNDVVVVGYGTMKKTDLTGSVSSVSTEKLNAKGAPSVMANLQGSTPGVNITQSTGRTNGDFNIEIRGKSSISSSTKPLYVVDGVICGDIQFLNPQDIERIDILKDASSTAIYGSRATAGVVMVTTKGGSNVNKAMSKPTISYDGYYGVSKVARMPDFMDGSEYVAFRFARFQEWVGTKGAQNQFYMRSGDTGIGQAFLQKVKSDLSSPYRLLEMIENGEEYDWPSLATQDGNQQNHYLSVSGAGENVNYHFGVGYDGNKGTYVGDKQNKINFKGSVDAKINKVVRGGFSFNMAHIDNEYANDDAISDAFRIVPLAIPYDEEGNINHKPGGIEALGTDDHNFSNNVSPLDAMKNTYKQRETWRALGNIYLQFDLMKGLNFKTTFSPSYTSYRQGFFSGYRNPATGLTYNDKDLSESEAQVTQNRSFSWTWDNIVNYNTRFGEDHSLGVMGLLSATSSNKEEFVWVANGVMENTDWWNMKSGTYNADDSSSDYREESMLSYALRLNYGYKDRYLVTATIRWDGSSKFAKEHRWGSFPSLAVAWRASEEAFLKKLDWLSNLKLRLSYGITGNNAGIGEYATQQVVDGPVYYPFGNVHFAGYYPKGIVDKELSWEKSHEINLGVDFGFLNNRISGSIDLYQKTSKDLLYNVKLPLVSGGGTMATNIGEVRNKGVEVSLTTVNIDTKDWNWTTTFTFAHNNNEVREINGTGMDLPASNLFIGHTINNVYNYEWAGIVSDKNMTVPNTEIAIAKGFTPGETVKSYDYYYTCYGWTEGQPIITDRNGDGTINDEDKFIYSSDPVWIGSLTSDLSWKNWDFSFSIYTKQNYKVNSAFMDKYVSYRRSDQNLAVDRYIPAGTLVMVDGIREDGTYINPVYQATTHYGEYPMFNANDGLGLMETNWKSAKCVVNGSFVKVKNITLGYTFSKNLLKHIGCQHLRLYATVTNPFVFTSYKGFDPEWANATNKNDGPSTITYQFGASIKF